MSEADKPDEPEEKRSESNEFENAGEGEQAGIVSEFIEFLGENKKFWMIPLLVALLGLGALILLGGTSAAPFIYTLF
ncbi:MAG: DUF5989 family protein [Verrucomicrobiia bacterium]|jgi:hypothetical protein